MNVNYPFQFDPLGRTDSPDDDDKHVRDMIEQVLFTSPGERVNRPTFGSGLMQLIFQPNSDQLVATVQFLVSGALQQWLGHLIEINDVDVQNNNSTLTVKIAYTIRRTNQPQETS